jgi:hypothetical protein
MTDWKKIKKNSALTFPALPYVRSSRMTLKNRVSNAVQNGFFTPSRRPFKNHSGKERGYFEGRGVAVYISPSK